MTTDATPSLQQVARQIDAMTIDERRYLRARLKGMSNTDASEEIGISAAQGKRLEKKEDVKLAYQRLLRIAIPPEKMVELVAQGAEAERTVSVSAGDGDTVPVTEPDWRTRHLFIKMAAEHAGYADKSMGESDNSITVTINHIGQIPGTPPAKQLPEGATIDAA